MGPQSELLGEHRAEDEREHHRERDRASDDDAERPGRERHDGSSLRVLVEFEHAEVD